MMSSKLRSVGWRVCALRGLSADTWASESNLLLSTGHDFGNTTSLHFLHINTHRTPLNFILHITTVVNQVSADSPLRRSAAQENLM